MRRMLGWVLRLFPELQLFEDPAARLAAWKKASSASLHGKPLFWLGIVATAVGVALLVFALRRVVSVPRIVADAITAILILSLISIVPIHLFKRPIQKSLRQQLLDAGVPVCTGC